MIYQVGQDPEKMKARRLLPDPNDNRNAEYFKVTSATAISKPVDPPPEVTPWTKNTSLITFRRELVGGPGNVFWAWVCVEDGKVYL